MTTPNTQQSNYGDSRFNISYKKEVDNVEVKSDNDIERPFSFTIGSSF